MYGVVVVKVVREAYAEYKLKCAVRRLCVCVRVCALLPNELITPKIYGESFFTKSIESEI